MAYPSSNLSRGRVQDNGETSPTLDTACLVGVVEDDVDIQIRRLTPRECFRLQGFPDEYYERAEAVCPERELYKQAGNSVTVNVIYEIAKLLQEVEQ